MNDPSYDLIVLDKICKELQKEIAFATPDAEKMARLAEDVVHLGNKLADWAKKQ